MSPTGVSLIVSTVRCTSSLFLSVPFSLSAPYFEPSRTCPSPPSPVAVLKKHFTSFPKGINNPPRSVERPSRGSPRNFRPDNGSLTRIINASTAFDRMYRSYRSKSIQRLFRNRSDDLSAHKSCDESAVDFSHTHTRRGIFNFKHILNISLRE